MSIKYVVEVRASLSWELEDALSESVDVEDVEMIGDIDYRRTSGQYNGSTEIQFRGTVEGVSSEEEAIDAAKESVHVDYDSVFQVDWIDAEIVETIRPHLIFEDTTSSLYASNDGRLQLETDTSGESRVYVLKFDAEGEEVFATHNRVLADAYLAGYDLAHENA